MSTLCCAVLVEGDVPNAESLSPMRIAIPAESVSGELSSCEDSPVTTPEASTDSDDDSSFESDDDEGEALPICSRRRKAPSCLDSKSSWPGCVTTTTTNGDDKIIERKTYLQQQRQQQQPATPLRKVRFTLHDEYHHQRGVKNVRGLIGASSPGTRARHRSWGKDRRAAIQDSALQDVGMLARRQQHHHQSLPGQKKPTATATTIAKTTAWKKRTTAAAPFKSTSANVSTTNTAHASSVSAVAAAAALVRAAPSHYSIPVPVSTKKRKVSTATSPSSSFPSSSSIRHQRETNNGCSRLADSDGTNGGGSGGKLIRSRDRPGRPSSRGTVAMAAAVALKAEEAAACANATARTAVRNPAETTALKTKDDADAADAFLLSSRALPLPCRRRRPAAAAAAEVDLSCKEVLDVDALMKPKGELRTPICRFLVPGWPEGVEGYEEQGGWRRLGGCHTRESFPRGRRSI